MSRAYIADLERGAIAVPRDPDNLKALAKALGIRLRDLARPTGWYDEDGPDDDWLSQMRADPDLSDPVKQTIEEFVGFERRRRLG